MPSDVPLVWAVGDRCRVFVRDREREGIVCRVLPIEVDVAVEGMGILYLSRDELRLSRIEEERALLRRAVGVASELERLREEVSGVLDAFARDGVQKKGNGDP